MIIINLCILLRFGGIRTNSASWKGWIYIETESLECYYLKVRSAVTIFIYSRERGREGGREGLTSKCDIVSSHTRLTPIISDKWVIGTKIFSERNKNIVLVLIII